MGTQTDEGEGEIVVQALKQLLAVSAIVTLVLPSLPAGAHGGSEAAKAMMSKMMSGPSMKKLHGASGRAFEIAFLSEMIEHHRGAIRMSEGALRAAKRADVKASARKVMQKQKQEIGQMTAWLKAWHRRSPDPRLQAMVRSENAPMMGMFRTECQIDCDEAFPMQMKMHHQMGIHMAQLALKKNVRQELRLFAQRMIEDQTQDNKRFEALLHAEDHH